MSVFIVSQYELYGHKYKVEADNEADAIVKILNDEGTEVGEYEEAEFEYVQIVDSIGLPCGTHKELTAQLHKMGVIDSKRGFIPSIRSIKKVED